MDLVWFMSSVVLWLLLNEPSRAAALPPGLADSTITFVRAGNLTWILKGDMKDLLTQYGHWNRKRVVSVNVLNQAESDILMNLTTVIDDAYFAVAPLLLAKPTEDLRNMTDNAPLRQKSPLLPPPASASIAARTVPLNDISSGLERPHNDSPATSHVDEASQIVSNCIYYSNLTYTCKTDCDSEVTAEPIAVPFPDDDRLTYYINNCSTSAEVDVHRRGWNSSDGLISIPFERNDTGKVVATCTFYQTRWYECIDVSDCRRENNHCRGGTPWRGYYTGTMTEGFRGNVTAKAINNAVLDTPTSPHIQS